MSKLRQEIQSSMQSFQEEGEFKTRAGFCFPKKFIGFKGHFPGRPVLPGVCKIQTALLVFEKRKQKNVRLAEVVLAKFFLPVTCNQEIEFHLEEHTKGAGDSLLAVKVNSADKKVAEMQLRVNILE